MKGIILTGGSGTRMRPTTLLFNKHIIPVNEKLIIDYPINTLIKSGVKEITVVLGGDHFDQVVAYLKGGSERGVKFNYIYQERPSGIAEAIQLCEPYMRDAPVFNVCLGDNIFQLPIKFENKQASAKISLISTPELNRFGVATIDDTGKIIKIEEKPQQLDNEKKNFAITGFYQFTPEYFNYFNNIQPSARGEYEITDIILQYLKNGKLDYCMSKGWWSDAGTFSSLEKVRGLVKSLPVNF
jgi:glucose-1-phosphate thymidylyltransferase